jgi:hypothetical protein
MDTQEKEHNGLYVWNTDENDTKKPVVKKSIKLDTDSTRPSMGNDFPNK